MKIGDCQSLLFVIIAVVLEIMSGFALEIVSEDSEISNYEETNVTLDCQVNAESFDYFFNQIIWYKSLSVEREVQINTGAVVNEPFNRSGRYSISPKRIEAPTNLLLMPLTITDLRLSDNGTYRCYLFDRQKVLSSVTYSLIIPVPVDKVTLTVGEGQSSGEALESDEDGKRSFEFLHLETRSVRCRSFGGNPLPRLHIFRGSDDLTDQFKVKLTERKVSGVRGVDYHVTDIELSNELFQADLSHHRQQMRCVAKIPGHLELERSVTGRISIRFPPKFDCPRSEKAFLATNNYRLHCFIRANPIVRFDAIWWETFNGPNTTNITVHGGNQRGFRATATEVVHNDETVVKATLSIDSIDETKFGIYSLWARNEVGREQFYITLNEAIVEEPILRSTYRMKYFTMAIPARADGEKQGEDWERESSSSTSVPTISMLIVAVVLITICRVNQVNW